MLRELRRAARFARVRLTAHPISEGVPALPPTSRDVFGPDMTARQAIAYNRARVATATALALYRSGQKRRQLSDDDLDSTVRGLKFPHSRPSPETRAAIRAALAVLEADPTITVI
ncbi:hypothetical protein OOK58_00065 [Streptomyces sp. NBC_01728]|uniref:hypothetical protein n=1 Tax=unclassified Streptomyces TaxID=2593676 RepID=UPI00225343EB|nr:MULTISPECIES: hypothetical protein [unclassified Streptomyces]MCX4462467.1 hypothetical protein [Streptomyces sp. NBC_01719]MCX4490027.1 hypothetical protein [Streptomyces sp. NBC_01728]